METSEITRVEKPWGYELHWAKTDRYVGKILHIQAGHALSLQFHRKKDETILLWSGRMRFEIDRGGGRQHLDLEPGTHRVEIRAPGHEPITFEVKIAPRQNVTYKGELKKAM